MEKPTVTPPKVMAYFSHSYRPCDNRINLHFWETLSDYGLYFGVDPPSDDRRPMDVTYLEWLMAQSACFVAVLLSRNEAPPGHCSPYQLFEYRLAVRARKPRLVFLEADLDPDFLGINREEVVPFRCLPGQREAVWEEGQSRAHDFAARVLRLGNPGRLLRGPIGLVVDDQPVYADVAQRLVTRIEGDLQRRCRVIHPARYDSDYRLLMELDDCDVLVAEIRPPYLPANLYGVIHGRFLPTLRIAHLGPQEEEARVSETMGLAVPVAAGGSADGNWPVVLGGYQVDPTMRPVLFWQDPDTLARQVVERLQRITHPSDPLDDKPKARKYFLRLGRLGGQVFISNASTLNGLAARLATALRDDEALRVFHYKDADRDAGKPNWKDDIRGKLESCTLFLALIDDAFNNSEWCLWETEVAIERFKTAGLELLTYNLGAGKVPQPLWRIDKHVQEINGPSLEAQVTQVVRRVVESFERGRRVALDEDERAWLIQVLENRPGLTSDQGVAEELKAAGLPEMLMARVLKAVAATHSGSLVAAVVDALADWPDWVRLPDVPPRTALGMFLVHATRDAGTSVREAVGRLVRERSLMPDVRHWLNPRSVTRELGLALEYDGSESRVGTFTRIVEQRLEGYHPANAWAGNPPRSDLVRLVSGQPDWQKWTANLGQDLASGPAFDPLRTAYREAVGPGMAGVGRLGICVAGGASALRVPVEWARLDVASPPLALSHPVRRYVTDAPEKPRPTLRELLTAGLSTPVRVLIAGADAGDLPWVTDEIEAVYNVYARWFAMLGWPQSDLVRVPPREATRARLEHAIRERGFHLLHFAGHGATAEDEPALAVIDDRDGSRYVPLSATTLGNWIRPSPLRLVYLSSCEGAAAAADEPPAAIRRFESLAQAVVNACVPEVVGFLWPIRDRQSQTFAQEFHERYLHEFDAAVAAYEARRSFHTSAQIWAAAMVIAQHDSPLATP